MQAYPCDQLAVDKFLKSLVLGQIRNQFGNQKSIWKSEISVEIRNQSTEIMVILNLVHNFEAVGPLDPGKTYRRNLK